MEIESLVSVCNVYTQSIKYVIYQTLHDRLDVTCAVQTVDDLLILHDRHARVTPVNERLLHRIVRRGNDVDACSTHTDEHGVNRVPHIVSAFYLHATIRLVCP